jgi:hypothetical protein
MVGFSCEEDVVHAIKNRSAAAAAFMAQQE